MITKVYHELMTNGPNTVGINGLDFAWIYSTTDTLSSAIVIASDGSNNIISLGEDVTGLLQHPFITIPSNLIAPNIAGTYMVFPGNINLSGCTILLTFEVMS